MRAKQNTLLGIFLIGFFYCISPAVAATGTHLGDVAESMAPGTWALLAEDTPDLNAAINANVSAKHTLTFAIEGKWNPATKEAFYYGGDVLDDKRFVKYRAIDDQWEILMDPAPGGGGHTYDYQAIDTQNQKYYMENWEYDIQTGALNQRASVNAGRAHAVYEYFPGKGLMVYFNSKLDKLPDGSNSWTRIGSNFGATNSLHSIGVYNAVHNVLLFGGGDYNGDTLWIMDANESVSSLGNTPLVASAISANGGKGAVPTFDPVSGDFLVVDTDLSLWQFRHTTNNWTRVQNDISQYIPKMNNFVAIPNSTYGVVMFVLGRQVGSWPNRVWLYKHTAGGSPADTTPPSTPEGLQVSSLSSSHADLFWNPSTDNNGVTGYRVFRNETQSPTLNTTTYSDAGLASSTNFSYTVQAFDAADNGLPQSPPLRVC